MLESDPFRRLSYTWHSFTPEWAAAYGFDEDKRVRMASASRTRAAFDIEPVDDQAKLTVVHDNFDEDSLVASLVSEGWPHVISSLKTFIESGELAEASD